MKLIECPRDAMQGLTHIVPTDLKTAYLNALLKVGFDTLDAGSFVSPKAVPQMADTTAVLAGLDLSSTRTKLLAIVANLRGAEQALDSKGVHYLGFPLSVSETFQQRNTNKSIAQALTEVETMQKLCAGAQKELVIYLSMGFGNPYGDPYSPEVVSTFTRQLADLGIRIIAPSDTVGSATPEAIERLFSHLINQHPEVEFGAHLHAVPGEVEAKVDAVIRSGVRRIDGALRGFGGCPMAADDLTGNLPTEGILPVLEKQNLLPTLNMAAFGEAMTISREVFGY
ncbi:hydroxymethylglutaryl-CoA lyase [Arsenicibacter rosenii]|uniref:Hydroxymethylglutaryl-CoA lyase n=1 Tax=Arsenicibacter rosenii TaxID=1750698 RepID=A0A1S2VPZ9_9BACT|nr:hydroxymethylglutaryl-CoA lyase [Arsenicibacter rosenii]OIN60824.1 hydroxymethylglutaryl-CoA lyase [Arsenicibacter rosenii]